MVEELSDGQRILLDTFYTIARKVPLLLTPPKRPFNPRIDLGVDCDVIGFSYPDLEYRNFFFAVCNHPDRGGPVMGCLLTEENSEGRIAVVAGAECGCRVCIGSEEARDLRIRMETEEREKPFDF